MQAYDNKHKRLYWVFFFACRKSGSSCRNLYWEKYCYSLNLYICVCKCVCEILDSGKSIFVTNLILLWSMLYTLYYFFLQIISFSAQKTETLYMIYQTIKKNKQITNLLTTYFICLCRGVALQAEYFAKTAKAGFHFWKTVVSI